MKMFARIMILCTTIICIFSCVVARTKRVQAYDVAIRNYSTLDREVVKTTYQVALGIFEQETGCLRPANENVSVQDSTLFMLNNGHNIFAPNGFSFIVGLYSSSTETIYLASENPNKHHVLFHEFLHFMFEQSPNCRLAKGDAITQHIVIRQLEEIYYKLLGEVRQSDDEWLISALNGYGIKLHK